MVTVFPNRRGEQRVFRAALVRNSWLFVDRRRLREPIGPFVTNTLYRFIIYVIYITVHTSDSANKEENKNDDSIGSASASSSS